MGERVRVDLVLSSGFLAFAEQTGFLAGVEDLGIEVEALCGTSSGALAGSLWLAGVPAREVFEQLCERRPLAWVRPSWRPWEGMFGLEGVLAHLSDRLPADFDGLSRPFGAGVARGGRAELLLRGPLPAAVAASCAVPWLFRPVEVDGVRLQDGGAVDRTALAAWRRHRGPRRTVVHVLQPTHGPEGVPLQEEQVVRSPRSGATLWSLGDVEGRFAATRARTVATLGPALGEAGRSRV